MALLDLPDPPYFVVIFSARLSGEILSGEIEGYSQIAAALGQLVSEQKGYLGHQSVTGPDGREITVSYWKSEAAIQAWREQEDHKQAQMLGKHGWYDYYQIQVAVVERAYRFDFATEKW